MPINTQTTLGKELGIHSTNFGGVDTLKTATGMSVAEILSNPLEFLTEKISQ